VPQALERQFLDHSINKLRQYDRRIAACIENFDVGQLWARGGENENAIGNLVLHLCGNVRQWIVSGVGGQPDIRDRNAEFDARGGVAAADLIGRLHATVEEASAVLEPLTAARLEERITVQNYDVSVLEAVYHVVEHFAMHTGQIIFATKMLTGADLEFYKHLRTTAPHAQKTP
jgi:uncharacterized damage-inducible protein DinB